MFTGDTLFIGGCGRFFEVGPADTRADGRALQRKWTRLSIKFWGLSLKIPKSMYKFSESVINVSLVMNIPYQTPNSGNLSHLLT